jgi:hypothetical protein
MGGGQEQRTRAAGAGRRRSVDKPLQSLAIRPGFVQLTAGQRRIDHRNLSPQFTQIASPLRVPVPK